MMENTIFDLKFHEEFALDSSTKVFRVSGGWIYKFYKRKKDDEYIVYQLICSSFVPYNEEFKK